MARTSLPQPQSGLVIGYSYLWENEFRAGRDEGNKDRPCVVVIAIRTEDGDIVVTVAPITHRQPTDPIEAIELPSTIKRLLGLDDARSWLICAELNRFVWPGPDLRPISLQHPGQFVYGTLPRPFMLRLFARLQELRKRRRPSVIVRSV